MTDGRPGACMTDDRPKACHDTRQAEGLHMTHDSHPRDSCQCLVRGALGGQYLNLLLGLVATGEDDHSQVLYTHMSMAP